MGDTITTGPDLFGLNDDGTLSGVSPLVRRQYSPQRAQALTEAARLWERVWRAGDPRAAVQVQEALSTSDLFRSATGDLLDRELEARYADQAPQWASFAARTTVRNFKPKTLVDLAGGRAALDAVPELGEYPTADHLTAERQIAVRKFGRRFSVSWEALVNDDLDELQTIPAAYAQAAAATEDRAANSILFDATTGAPNTTTFRDYTGSTPAGPNLTPSTLALTSANVQTALTAVSTRRNRDGELVAPDGLILMVGVAQELAASEILSATEVRVTVSGRETTVVNPLRGRLTLVVNRRLPGNAWFLLPQATVARGGLYVAFLRGYESPDLRMRADTGTRVGGGGIDPTEGDFNEDAVHYRVRHVVGGALGDPLHLYASTGAGV